MSDNEEEENTRVRCKQVGEYDFPEARVGVDTGLVDCSVPPDPEYPKVVPIPSKNWDLYRDDDEPGFELFQSIAEEWERKRTDGIKRYPYLITGSVWYVPDENGENGLFLYKQFVIEMSPEEVKVAYPGGRCYEERVTRSGRKIVYDFQLVCVSDDKDEEEEEEGSSSL